ncbi:MAG: bacteriohemerythrin [Melioribacteraceae bacterium]
MDFFELSENEKLGIQVLDDQHKRLMQIMGNLYKALIDENGKRVVSFILDDLLEYTYYHLETEEKYMHDIQHPEYLIHKIEHEEFAAKLEKIREKISEEEAKLTIESVTTLKNWWKQHIAECDLLLRNTNEAGTK